MSKILVDKAVIEQAKQEPVAWYSVKGGFNTCGEGKPLYAAPARTKDLTDDELIALWESSKECISFKEYEDCARAVIAAYKEKNQWNS